MILEFTTANFKSFKTIQTFTMRAANISSKYKEIDTNNVISITEKIKILKSKAIYGANASGKSNLVSALFAYIMIVKNSVKEEKILKKIIKKYELSFENTEIPTFFQLIFAIKNDDNVNIIYRYGFEIFENKIISEWLFGVPKKVEVQYFIREGMNVKVNERVFKEAKKFEDLTKSGDSDIFRTNSLFLSAVSSMGGSFAKSIVNAISIINILSGIDDPIIREFASENIEIEENKNEILGLLRAADFGIEDIGKLSKEEEFPIEEMPLELRELLKSGNFKKTTNFYTKRCKFRDNEKIEDIAVDFDEWESEGTKKFFYLSPLLIRTLKEGRTLIIDEFDARLHPLLTKKIVNLFNSNLTNSKNAQLIFVTHDTNLLKQNLLRRDQICFIDKDKYGNSTLKTLIEIKGVRNDSSIDKEYIQGKFGAVPFLDNIDKKFTQLMYE